MVALRSYETAADDVDAREPWPRAHPADWLTLQQTACEMNVSISTVRRMLRKGLLRNRIVPRQGGFRYLIFMPDSRHGRDLVPPADAGGGGTRTPIHITDWRASDDDASHLLEALHDRDRRIDELERQVEHLSDALARTLRVRQRALPPGMGEPDRNPVDPYGRYRWLARRRRWWPF